MKGENPVLVLISEGDVNRLKIEYIANDNIPELLNGESGFHVYHVRMLTELILNELKGYEPSLNLTDDEIRSIAIASSLHDIGKMRIPKSILDYPGKLSPVEYDIIKKHSVFGEEIISAATGEVSQSILDYAKIIARSHHERYDGTGYPDGLSGDKIHISAQVVALADAFDALTSSRSYKAAFSQDVAIEMIANGMCGVFKSELIDCLLKVVNNKVLVDIRERLSKERRVVLDADVFAPKRILFTGNTRYVDEVFIDGLIFDSKIMILGQTHMQSGENVKVYKIDKDKNPPYEAIFETYDFDVIVYFASELTYNSHEKSDIQELRTILASSVKTQKKVKFIYFSSLDAAFESKDDRTLIAASKENLCEYFCAKHSLDLKVIRIPYLYSGIAKKDFLRNIFDKMHSSSDVTIPELADSRSYFLSAYDLASLFNRLVDSWKKGSGILNVNDEFGISFLDISRKLTELKPDISVDFTGQNPPERLSTNNKAIRNEYGWFSRISVLEDLEEQYDKYLASKGEKDKTWWDKIKDFIQNHSLPVKLAELAFLFIITEILLWTTSSSLYFSIVDFRMAFIIIMATIHGLKFGMAASALSSVSWLVSKVISGTKLITIFYEPSNWLAFVYFFLLGALCGYMSIRNKDTINFLKEEKSLLEEKLVFIRDLYEDTFREKRDLKKQIIGSKDSFGKIFDVTRNLDTVEPRELYLKIMETFEDILENKSISVYSVTENSAFGRLEVASRDIMSTAARSISMDTYTTVLKAIEDNEIWKNTALTEGLPMYAAGVYRKNKLELLIFLWHAETNQRSLYYVNLFKILRDLVQMSLLRAFDYNQAIYERQYIAGTHIMNAGAFTKLTNSFRKMAERKVSNYVLLGVKQGERTLEELDKILTKLIRSNDIAGVNEDGQLCLLLSQATQDDLKFILPRFEKAGIETEVL